VLDKSRLEREIERQELCRKPIGIYFLIFLLLIGLFAVGVYTLRLKEDLSKKEQEIILMKENFQKERVRLLDRIKVLEKESTASKTD
jgi:hypothetical protein